MSKEVQMMVNEYERRYQDWEILFTAIREGDTSAETVEKEERAWNILENIKGCISQARKEARTA